MRRGEDAVLAGGFSYVAYTMGWREGGRPDGDHLEEEDEDVEVVVGCEGKEKKIPGLPLAPRAALPFPRPRQCRLAVPARVPRRCGGAAVALARASDGAVNWSRPDAPAVEEVVWPDGVDFVAGDGALAFGTGVRDMDIVGPFELVVSDGAGGGLAELQLPSVSCLRRS
ncbi:uncharacterized protein LOC119273261 [Triticum dicoccoides]|uniref:uncharacterized protein LOC119273261 n=1 Tax=Triticum dicoccoides TaxID=85692 RepID=UPI00188E984E|nr:uncharacterized protein LOC119273261 [Triticum dicoccoides]